VAFTSGENEPLYVKVGISYVSEENARLNLQTELPGWDFDRVRQEARQEWNRMLGRFEVQGGTRDQQVNFYTAVYHAFFHPQTFS
ncbi:MAG: glycoside hydrolase family 92 protein, partial [Planctomycetales bacterium]|nr:glycoside hydrolase family 92 protein [Planctomycetales bacterium]NIP68901.1 glycoside hydrolase family 92 protein [Planctomycetales bacterium]